jgi:flavoprotein
VENVCPTNAFRDKKINLAYCFGCGMCSHYCRNDAFDMNAGSVDLHINDEDVTVPVILRQSDRLRANKLSLKLKQMIEKREFIL